MQLKRILAILLAATLIFSAFTVPSMAETVETSNIFEVGVVAETTTPISTSPVIYNQGEDVAVKISADQNTGFDFLRIKVSFDPEALEYVDHTSNQLFSNESINAKSGYVVYTVILNNVSEATGDLFTLNFKIKDAYCGETVIDTQLYQDREANCKNGADNVPFVGGSASFTVHKINTEEGVVTPPACTETGYTTYKCASCDEEVKGNIVDALTHIDGEPVEENRVEPTCTEEGTYESVVYCTICETELSRVECTIDALGHTEGEAVVENRVEPNCTDEGTYDSVVYCTVCDAELSREANTIDALEHNLVHHAEKYPTCTEIGWDAYDTCTRCDYTTYNEKAALGHDLVHHDAKDATCTEKGWDAYAACSRCPYTTYNEKAALGHTIATKEENRVEATCTTNGSYDIVVYCSVCSEELSRETKTTEALGHSLVNYDAKEATCTEKGWDAYAACSRCPYTTYNEKAALGHTIATKEENRVEATCTTNGSYDIVVYCSVCSEELSRETKTIEALGHSLVSFEAKEATCTEKGWGAYDVCSVCGYTTYEEIAALGHSFGEATVVEPEYKKEGYTTHTCTVCDHTEKYDITEALTYILGDVDGNEVVDSDDAVYLLYHTLLADEYPINQEADFDGDGDVDSDDAIYLLYHTLLSDEYPLHK